MPPSRPLTPAWLRAASDWSWRSLVLGFGIVAAVYALGYFRIIVLPVIIAVLVTTLLLPPKRFLTNRGLGDGAAAGITLVGGILVLALLVSLVAPSIGSQFPDLRTGVEDGVRKATDVLDDPPFNLSRSEIDDAVDRGLERLRENSSEITRGVTEGAVLLGEVLTGLLVVILLTFFFLKDGRQMWDWVIGLAAKGGDHRGADELGARIFAALSGYVRGIALVGLVDALLIGLGLVILGVPLVLPLMLLTFLAAFIPLIGAFLAGLAAVLIALVFEGLVTALIVLGIIILVQQIEGHLLYPLLMSRTVNLHPAVIVIALAMGGIVAGIVGVFLSVPVAGVISTVLSYVREDPAPESVLTGSETEEAQSRGGA